MFDISVYLCQDNTEYISMQTKLIYKTHDIQKAFILNQIVTIISSAKR